MKQSSARSHLRNRLRLTETAAGDGGDMHLVCFAHQRWDYIFQRPQHILTRAAASWPVMFVEEPVLERNARAHMRTHEAAPNVTVVTPHLPPGLTEGETRFVQRSLLNCLLADKQATRRVLWYHSPLPLKFTRGLTREVCVYDCMDEPSGLDEVSSELASLERELLDSSDLVFTGGASLYEAKRELHRKVLCFPGSVDVTHFARARQSQEAEPEDLAAISGPRLTYFGVIDERIDLELIDAVADARPDWQLVMIGPVLKIDPATLPKRPNIHWLGNKRYEELPAYLAHTDVGILPFANNAATRFISPTIPPQFLAAGVPVVSTLIRDVLRTYGESGLVEVVDTADRFIARTQQLLGGVPQGWLERVDDRLQDSSWDSTWSAMRRQIEQVAARKRRPAIAEKGLMTPAAVSSAAGTLASAAALKSGAMQRSANRRSP